MLDDELKKELLKMKLDDVVETIEKIDDAHTENIGEAERISKENLETEAVSPSKTSYKKFLISQSALFITVVLSCVGIGGYTYQNFVHHAYNPPQLPPQAQSLVAQAPEVHKEDPVVQAPDEDDVEDAEESDTSNALALAWADKINQLDPDLGKSVQILWNMLERRQEELSDLSEEIADLLYDNAKTQIDLYAQEISVLFSRYQVVNARYALGIAQQMHAIDQMAKKNKEPLVSQYVQELFSALDCDVYANYRVSFVKDLVQKEDVLKQVLQALTKSETFAQIEQELLQVKEVFKNLEKDGVSQVFSQLVLLQQEISEAVQQALSRCFQNDQVTTNRETEALLDAILQESGLDEERKIYWKNEYQKLVEKSQLQAKEQKKPKIGAFITSETV